MGEQITPLFTGLTGGMTSNHFLRKQTINTETKPEPSQLKSKRIRLHHKQPTYQPRDFLYSRDLKGHYKSLGNKSSELFLWLLAPETAELVVRRWVGYHTGPWAFCCFGTTGMSFIVPGLQAFHQAYMKTKSAFEL